jgi:hypothetical protein
MFSYIIEMRTEKEAEMTENEGNAITAQRQKLCPVPPSAFIRGMKLGL